MRICAVEPATYGNILPIRKITYESPTQIEISKNIVLELRTFVLKNRVSINVLNIRTKW